MKRILVLSGLFFALVFSFQNCSVYSSSGRDLIDSSGIVIPDAACLENMNQPGCEPSLNLQGKNQEIMALENAACSQYLSAGVVSYLANGSAVETRSFADLRENLVRCMYGLADPDAPIEHLICEVGESFREQAEFPSLELEEVFSNAAGAAYALEPTTVDESCQLIAPRVGILGAKCCAIGNNETQRQDFLRKIALEMVGRLR